MRGQQQSWFKSCVRWIPKLFLLWPQGLCCLPVHPNRLHPTQLLTQTQHLPQCLWRPCNIVGILIIRRCCRLRWTSVNKRVPHVLNGVLTEPTCNLLQLMRIRQRRIFLVVVQISKSFFSRNRSPNSITYFLTIFF